MAVASVRWRVRLRPLAVAGPGLAPLLLVTGLLLLALALAMLVPMLADLSVGHPDWEVFLASAALTGFIGATLALANRGAGFEALTTRQVFLLTTMVWTALSAFSAVPLALSGLGLSLADAVFEAVSGITTTGSTVMTGLDSGPPGILLWRAILQWLGGIGIIVTAVAILPVLSVGGMQLFRSESSDRSEKALPRSAQIASAIGGLYLLLTLACLLAYWSLGMSLFEASVHAMTTVATGGFSTSDASIGHFASPEIEWAATLFMASGGIPFVLYLQALRGRPALLWRDVQVRWYLSILALASLLLAGWLVRLSFALVAGTLAALGLDYLTAMSASVTALSNVGPGLGPIIGPAGDFGDLPEAAKWVLSLAMLLGRLELFTVLVLATPMFWRG